MMYIYLYIVKSVWIEYKHSNKIIFVIMFRQLKAEFFVRVKALGEKI